VGAARRHHDLLCRDGRRRRARPPLSPQGELAGGAAGLAAGRDDPLRRGDRAHGALRRCLPAGARHPPRARLDLGGVVVYDASRTRPGLDGDRDLRATGRLAWHSGAQCGRRRRLHGSARPGRGQTDPDTDGRPDQVARVSEWGQRPGYRVHLAEVWARDPGRPRARRRPGGGDQGPVQGDRRVHV
jgi:hypothetical protein